MKRVYVFLALVGLSFAATEVRAQISSSKQLVGLFREVIAKPSQSIVRVQADGKDTVLGVIVSSDGWILTKLSDLKGKKTIVCRLPDGKELEAEVFGKDEPFDLVMLKVDATGLTPIEWTDSKVAKIGHWVASVGASEDPVAIGVVSVAAREVKGAKFAAPSGAPGGYLGVQLDLDFAGVRVQEVLPKTPALTAGLKTGDLIVAVNDQKVTNPEEFQGILSQKKPKEEVTLSVLRDEMLLELKATLVERPGSSGGKSRGEQQNAMGSKLSQRKAGFPVILQHDSVLKPSDCGGLLVNLEGKVIGINIARAGRTETYAIPSEVVRPMLQRLRMREPELKEIIK